MAERFTRLFQLGNDLYLDGSPVIVYAGALLNDTVTGAVIAQIKYQNISEKKIVAAKGQLCAYDAMRAALDERIEYPTTIWICRQGLTGAATKPLFCQTGRVIRLKLSGFLLLLMMGHAGKVRV